MSLDSRRIVAEEKTAKHTAKAEEYLQAMDDCVDNDDTYNAVRYAALAEAHLHRVDQFLTMATGELM